MKFSLTLAAILSALSLEDGVVDAFGVSTNKIRASTQSSSSGKYNNAVHDVVTRSKTLSTDSTSRGYVRTFMTPSENESGAKEIKVGVIGCGRIGIVHLGAITKAPNVTPVIVSNPTVSKAEQGESN